MSFLRILGQKFFILWFALRRLLLFPAVQFLSSARHTRQPSTLFPAFAIALFLLSIIHPFLWWCSLLLFWLCLGVSLLNRQIHGDKKSIIEGEMDDIESHWLPYDQTLTFGVRFAGHIFLLLSLVQILRQSALFWGAQLFKTSSSSPFIWVLYAFDLFWKAALFGIPEIYGLQLVSIEHVGFWGATLVFLSRLIILALVLGAFLQWRELYQTAKTSMSIAKTHPSLALIKLRAILRMYPQQSTRFCLWTEDERWPRQSKAVLLEALGSCRKEEVLEVLKKHFREREDLGIARAVLRGMAVYGKGPLPLLRGLFFQGAARTNRAFGVGKQDRDYSKSELLLREEACRTLAAWGRPASLSLLSQVAKEGDAEKVRSFAIQALGESQSQDALPLLIELMQERELSKHERFAARDAILTIADLSKEIRDSLQKDLQTSQYPDQRRFAAMILGELIDHQSFFTLNERLPKESDPDVRMYLLKGIAFCLNQKTNVVEFSAEQGRMQELLHLVHWLEDAIDNEENIFIRIAAIHAYAACSSFEKLGVISKEQIILRLRKWVNSSDTQIVDAAGDALEILLGGTQAKRPQIEKMRRVSQTAKRKQERLSAKRSIIAPYPSTPHPSTLLSQSESEHSFDEKQRNPHPNNVMKPLPPFQSNVVVLPKKEGSEFESDGMTSLEEKNTSPDDDWSFEENMRVRASTAANISDLHARKGQRTLVSEPSPASASSSFRSLVAKELNAEFEKESYSELEEESYSELERTMVSQVSQEDISRISQMLEISQEAEGEFHQEAEEDFHQEAEVSLQGFPNELLSLYEPEQLILRGPYASTWRGFNLDDEAEVVFKISHPNDQKAYEVIAREYQVLKRFQSIGVVPLLDFHEIELLSGMKQASFVMPWLGEKTLFHHMKEKKEKLEHWTLEEVSSLMEALCQTIYGLHQGGWFHGDLKPENIFWLDGYVILCDFESAQPFADSEDSEFLLKEPPLGTPYYMAPEQLREDKLEQRVDVYALGVLAYELITGFLPQGISPPILSNVRGEFSLRVDGVLAKATAHRAEERYDCPLVFWKELYSALDGHSLNSSSGEGTRHELQVSFEGPKREQE